MADYPYIGGPYDGGVYEDKGTPPTNIVTKREQDTGQYWLTGEAKYQWREAAWKGPEDGDVAA